MRCIFCKLDSSSSRSVEHIIPESLGNTTLVLKKGIVCDGCNNYFSKSVEKPFLESPGVKAMRFHEGLESKKGRVPPVNGMLSPGVEVMVTRYPRYRSTSVAVPKDVFEKVRGNQTGYLILPTGGEMPVGPVVSRFMAKVALEAMAARLTDSQEGLDYLCDHEELDGLRHHARKGHKDRWAVHVRRIYPSDARVLVEGHLQQVVHESDFLVTPENEWYFALALFGLEFTINLGGPDVDGYLRWLHDNPGSTPLYSPNNSAYPMPIRRGPSPLG